jgi:hypothetical protein
MPPPSPRRVAGLIAIALLAVAPADAAPGKKGSGSVGVAPGVLFAAREWDSRVFCLGLSASYAVADGLSLVTVPSLAFFESGTLIAMPVGLQLDVAPDRVPRLSFYARATVGIAGVTTGHGQVGLLMFDVGLKYAVQDWLFVGAEPVSFPVFLNGDTWPIFKPAVVAGFSF